MLPNKIISLERLLFGYEGRPVVSGWNLSMMAIMIDKYARHNVWSRH